jgi:hypothetical protein
VKRKLVDRTDPSVTPPGAASTRRITRSLIQAGALRPGLNERDAADIVHALASPEVYRLLVPDRGWPGERYQRWLSSILIAFSVDRQG